MLFNIFLTFLLVFLNGFFVAAEFAIVKVRLSQIELKASKGFKLAKVSKNIIANLDLYLSACQLGITLASLALGWIGEPVVAEIIISFFSFINLSIDPQLAHNIALPIAFVTITVLHIVFGEQAPKFVAIKKAEATTLFTSIPLRIFFWIFKPFIFFLNSFANFTIRILGIDPNEVHDKFTHSELKLIIEEGKKKGELKDESFEIIKKAFDFSERTVKQIMIPRTKIFACNISMASDEFLDRIIDSGYSRIPIYEDNLDNIIGIVYTKDLLNIVKFQNLIIIKDILRPVHFIPPKKKIIDLLRDFQTMRIQIAIITNEYGGTEGIVTMEDIVEELVGEIQDEYDLEAPLIEKINEKVFRASAFANIIDINEQLPHPITTNSNYDTINGMLSYISGKIPAADEKIIYDKYEFTILKRTKRSIIQVEIKFLG